MCKTMNFYTYTPLSQKEKATIKSQMLQETIQNNYRSNICHMCLDWGCKLARNFKAMEKNVFGKNSR